MADVYMRYMRQIFSFCNMAGAAALFTAYTALLYLWLPDGINKVFSHAASGYGAGALILVLAYGLLRGGECPPTPYKRLSLGHVVFLLLPMAPVVQYAVLNFDILGDEGMWWFLAIHAGIAGLCVLVIPFLLRFKVFLPIGITLSAALSYVYFNMAVLAQEWRWLHQGQFSVQMMVFAFTFALLLLLYPFRRNFLGPTLVVFFLSHTLLAIWNAPYVVEWRRGVPPVSMAFAYEQPLKSTQFAHEPDIYLLVFDAYVSQEIMQLYGIDNSGQEAFLREQGFRIYPRTYSAGIETMTSIPRLLNMTDVPRARQHEVAAGNATALRILKAQGYDTYAALGGYWFQRYPSEYNELPGVWTKADVRSHGLHYLLQASAEGQFRFNIGNSGSMGMEPRIEKKRLAIALNTARPKFLYSHTGPGHSQNSGRCLPDETARFEERLQKSNAEMQEDIRQILSQKREAIIVVMGDHGPQLTGDCHRMEKDFKTADITRTHVQDRLGAFLAIRWPERYKAQAEPMEIAMIQNTFHALFAALTGDEKVLDYRLPPHSYDDIVGVTVKDGIIRGGQHDGEALFVAPPNL